MTVSLDAMQDRLDAIDVEIVAWTAKRDRLKQQLDGANARLRTFQDKKTQLEADIAGYTPA